MNLTFALAFIPDKTLGLLPVPYLLQQSADNNFTIHKRLTTSDLQIEFVLDNPWLKDVIEWSEELTPVRLNKKVNKKYQKIELPEFMKDADRATLNYLNEIIDRKKVQIVSAVKANRARMFVKPDQVQTVYKEDMIHVSDDLASVRFGFEKKADTLHYKLKLYIKDELIDTTGEEIFVVANKAASIIYNKKLISFDNQDFNGNKLKPFLKKGEIVVNEKMQGVFFKKFIAPVVKKFEYDIEGFELTEIKTQLLQQLIIEKTFTNRIVTTPVFVYRGHKVEFYKKQRVFVNVIERNGNYSLESIRRDTARETALLKQLENLGFVAREKYFFLKDSPNSIHDFTEYFAPLIPAIKKLGFEIINNLFKAEINYSSAVFQFQTQQKQDWFDLHILITIGEFEIRFAQLRHHILTGEREFSLPDNSIFIIPEAWFSELYLLAKRTGEENSTRIHKTNLQFLKDNKFIRPDKTISKSIAKIETTTAIELPKALTAKLRAYQKVGFQWIYQLTQNSFGVCLADDMGLGKTLQVICVLQKYFETHGFNSAKKESPTNQLSLFDEPSASGDATNDSFLSALLVVPKSLIFNWIAELEKFAPDLTYVVYHGNNRFQKLENELHHVHLVITTYGIVRTDIDELKLHRFSYIVADESQAIKNPASKAFKAIVLLQADRKISITGTPIENSLHDLWAQLSFLNENILGSSKHFEESFVKPILDDHHCLEARELKLITAPFILRRLKKDVATELPEKIEQVVYCQMYDRQNEIYETEKSAIRNELMFAKSREKNVINALAMLNRLRQIAIHPELIAGQDEAFSGKFDSIVHTMNNLIEQGHKFLVFSSFVKHLELFENHFKRNNISYSILTGKHNRRMKIVDEFQQTPDIKPFLISIKAGGLGLNITAASYVLIIDPWWNPFVELQAIDRTHRIGQNRKVVVYRFITKNSIEEKMMALQHAKLKLSHTLLSESKTAGINFKEIKEMLEL